MSLPIDVRNTFREAWPDAIRDLAIPAISLELSLDETAFIGQWQPLFQQTFDLPFQSQCSSLETRINESLATWDQAVFPRIGYCSWKASIARPLPCRSAQQVMATIATPDDRIGRGLIAAISGRDPVWLHLVHWRDMESADEIRIFIRDGVAVGASVYDENTDDLVNQNRAETIRERTRQFVKLLNPALHMKSVVADILIDRARQDAVELIELNPFSSLSSAGHFEWQQGFDNTLRFANIQLDL